ncbi:MAG: PQQ-binding-like beta-propeller repeat protein [Planctomycetaceae bacterium]|jgi:outer membrane protein assembly factor BamB
MNRCCWSRSWWLPGLVALVLTRDIRADDWPQLLGPARTGVSAERGLLNRWPEAGPAEVWRVPGGVGMSGVVVVSDRALTLVQREGRQWAVCLAVDTGKELWRTDLAAAYRNPMGDGPRSTPTVAGEQVFALTGQGTLAALKLQDGSAVWSVDLLDQLQASPADYGMACSPLVVGDRVIVTIGAAEATVVALDTRTGKILWRAGQDFPAGYSSPALLEAGGRKQLVVFHGAGALGLDPQSGAELWSYPYVTDFSCNIATPLAIDGGIFLSAGENHGSVLLDLKPQGPRYEVQPRWTSWGSKSTFRNEWQTAVAIAGALYGFDNVGSAGPVTHLACIDPRTGERKWQELRFGKGNLTAADGKLFVISITGELAVVRADPQRFELLGRRPLLEKTRTAPGISGGRLFARDDHDIVCVDVRQN